MPDFQHREDVKIDLTEVPGHLKLVLGEKDGGGPLPCEYITSYQDEHGDVWHLVRTKTHNQKMVFPDGVVYKATHTIWSE